MQKLNFTEIKDILESELFHENEHHPAQWFDDYIFYSNETEFNDDTSPEFIEQFRKLGEFEMVEQFGGSDMGTSHWIIYHFKDHDVYIKFDGWYMSHSGSEYSDMFEVKPVQVTKIEYQPVEND